MYVQAAWKGHRVRMRIKKKKVVVARKRSVEVTKHAPEDKKLQSHDMGAPRPPALPAFWISRSHRLLGQ